MKFRTSVKIQKPAFQLSHSDSILCLGSCFAQNIGSRFAQSKFTTLLNPFGIVYNPISIYNVLLGIINRKKYSKNDLFLQNERWHSFDHHSAFSHADENICLEQINLAIEAAALFLKKTNRLVLTLGTSYVFEDIARQQIVANCHKLPAKAFNHFQLSTETIVATLAEIFNVLKSGCPDLEIILTVSPIRHIRLGLVENQRSKAALILSTQQIEAQLDFVHYFPSYEIILDDLRDYRFYEADMIHPNTQAIDYIWEQFGTAFFSEETIQLNKKIDDIKRASQHRPFNANSGSHRQFIEAYRKKMNLLEKQYPFLDFEKERQILD